MKYEKEILTNQLTAVASSASIEKVFSAFGFVPMKSEVHTSQKRSGVLRKLQN